jgi:small basic protein
MIAIPFAALVMGFLAVYVLVPPVPPRWADYVAIAIIAGLDAFVGAARNWLERRFDEAIFISGFFVNMALAALLAFFGDKLGVDLYLAVVVALGIRIFNNLGRTRALLVTARLEARRAGMPASSD